jgi:acyl-CoA synthetase (AMP-forming)/AMP-acid ligase II
LKEKFCRNNILSNKITELKNKKCFVVGVHIRKGDYKYWKEGKYYFSDDVYLKYMSNIESEINKISGRKCSFIIFSNENISINETENIIISRNKWYIDHFLMSQCDLLVGPPSTFTLWASYIGKVKYFHIEDNSGKISIDDFRYCRS